MRYGAYSSSEVKSSSDDEVKEKSYSSSVRILVLFYTVNFTTYSSKVDYTILTLVPRQDTTL